MNELLTYTYSIVTGFSILGGFTRYIYPFISSHVAEEVEPLNLKYSLLLSSIIGLALSTYFYVGISSSNVELGFILQLGLLAGVAVFKNLDRLHKLKMNKNM